jgi:hypothetical protein
MITFILSYRGRTFFVDAIDERDARRKLAAILKHWNQEVLVSKFFPKH